MDRPASTPRSVNPTVGGNINDHSAPGSIQRLPDLVAGRPTILITTASMRERIAGRTAEAVLAPTLHSVLTGVQSNPTIHLCEELARNLGSFPANTVLVGLGGGSVLDASKALAAIAGMREENWLSQHLRQGTPFPAGFKPPVIMAIPTTAGTGSEVTPWATIWDEKSRAKYSLTHPALRPDQFVLDPELTCTLPRHATIASGLDALSHAMESVWNGRANTETHTLATTAIGLLFSALQAVATSNQSVSLPLSVRQALQQGSTQAGLVMATTQTALAHSMSYPLTGELGLPHGLACSFTLPEILRATATASERHSSQIIQPILRGMGAGTTGTAVERLYQLFHALDVPTALAAHGVTANAIAELRNPLVHPARARNCTVQLSETAAKDLVRTALNNLGCY